VRLAIDLTLGQGHAQSIRLSIGPARCGAAPSTSRSTSTVSWADSRIGERRLTLLVDVVAG
jgi:hypothetical protein